MEQRSDDETIRTLLTRYRRIAVVGLSDNPARDSNRVARYLVRQGYTVFPVNPLIEQALGLAAYPNLASVPPPLEIVNIFRRAEHIPGIVSEAIAAGARAIWLQIGLYDAEAARLARSAGLDVVMDRCIMVEHSLRFG